MTENEKQTNPTAYCKHGLCSRQTVLPWENQADYDAIIDGLLQEYQADTATQRHLVSELADIIWRKQRLGQARQARAYRHLYDTLSNGRLGGTDGLNNLIKCVASHRGLAEDIRFYRLDEHKIRDMMWQSAAVVQTTLQGLQRTEKELAELLKGDRRKTRQELRRLLDNAIKDWRELLAEEYETETDESIRDFAERHILSVLRQDIALYRLQPEVLKQAADMTAWQEAKDDTLSRHETLLDRKFERTLAMLVKLKAMQSASGHDNKPTIPETSITVNRQA